MKTTTFKFFSFVVLVFLVMFYCSPEKPSLLDGNIFLVIAVFDTSGTFDPADSSRCTPLPGAQVTLASKEYENQFTFFSDSSGIVKISGILASDYEIFVEYQISSRLVLLASKTRSIYTSTSDVDTMFTHANATSPLVINEIYSCGPPNNVFYFYDQYVELYNRSDEIQYLDGMIITRCRTAEEIEPFIEVWDYVENTYAFQFPGTPGGKEYPVYPGQFVILASDAYDHSQVILGAVDLSHADWEFVNQLSSDYDNPDVPNLHNINPSRTTDYLINLRSDAIILATGTNYWQNGDYVDVHISTILDGVEYKSSGTTSKRLTRRLDSGYTGVGVSNYSGKSRERVLPGKDTNNSTVDFAVIDAPTPGYNH